MFDCLLVTSEGVRRCWSVPVVSQEIEQTVIGALRLVVIDRLESAKVEMLTDTDDLIRLEVVRNRARRNAN